VQARQRAAPGQPKVNARWCKEVDNFLASLADKYYRAKLGKRDEVLSDLELYIIELYSAYQNHILPAHTALGYSGQNPRLMEAFAKLAVKDAEIRKKNEG
jgi:hypothetical protein